MSSFELNLQFTNKITGGSTFDNIHFFLFVLLSVDIGFLVNIRIN